MRPQSRSPLVVRPLPLLGKRNEWPSRHDRRDVWLLTIPRLWIGMSSPSGVRLTTSC